MTTNVLLPWFLLCWMLPVIHFRLCVGDDPKSLSMAEDAVDDMYNNCNKAMTMLIKERWFKKENTDIFQNVWKEAETCANEKLKAKKAEHAELTKEHLQAICAYTSNYKDFYKIFNKAVRTSRTHYGSEFQFHSLHFWLTSAIQILNKNKECKTTYRRTGQEFTGEVKDKQVMRFGIFASSSYKTDLSEFGQKTCFKITTCLGASLQHYSQFDDEEEVLIPPYELFMITKVKSKDVKELSDCEVVHLLSNAGSRSNLNCNLVFKGSWFPDKAKLGP